MKFYTDIEAVLGVWDGLKMIEIYKEIETDDDKELIELLIRAGLRYDEPIKETPKPRRAGK